MHDQTSPGSTRSRSPSPNTQVLKPKLLRRMKVSVALPPGVGNGPSEEGIRSRAMSLDASQFAKVRHSTGGGAAKGHHDIQSTVSAAAEQLSASRDSPGKSSWRSKLAQRRHRGQREENEEEEAGEQRGKDSSAVRKSSPRIRRATSVSGVDMYLKQGGSRRRHSNTLAAVPATDESSTSSDDELSHDDVSVAAEMSESTILRRWTTLDHANVPLLASIAQFRTRRRWCFCGQLWVDVRCELLPSGLRVTPPPTPQYTAVCRPTEPAAPSQPFLRKSMTIPIENVR